ncbi:hypothetical protein ACLK1S_00735 [Escherichia coli]
MVVTIEVSLRHIYESKETKGKPTVILAQTIKGYGTGDAAKVKTSRTRLRK